MNTNLCANRTQIFVNVNGLAADNANNADSLIPLTKVVYLNLHFYRLVDPEILSGHTEHKGRTRLLEVLQECQLFAIPFFPIVASRHLL